MGHGWLTVLEASPSSITYSSSSESVASTSPVNEGRDRVVGRDGMRLRLDHLSHQSFRSHPLMVPCMASPPRFRSVLAVHHAGVYLRLGA